MHCSPPFDVCVELARSWAIQYRLVHRCMVATPKKGLVICRIIRLRWSLCESMEYDAFWMSKRAYRHDAPRRTAIGAIEIVT